VADRAAAYRMPGIIADGQDAPDVYRKAREAVDHARSGNGPVLLECETYRYYGHFLGDAGAYRSAEELESYRARDCIIRLGEELRDTHNVSAKRLDEIKAAAEERIDEAVAFAEGSPDPGPEELTADVYVRYR